MLCNTWRTKITIFTQKEKEKNPKKKTIALQHQAKSTRGLHVQCIFDESLTRNLKKINTSH